MPTLEEFQDLHSCIPDEDAFPPALMQNQTLFMRGVASLNELQRNEFWLFFKLLLVNKFSAYFTATVNDMGMRIGVRNPDQSDADLVLCRLFFPINSTPYTEINACTVEKRAFPRMQNQDIFSPEGLSPAMTKILEELRKKVPMSPIVKSFLADEKYNHFSIKKLLIARLPISHPVGGLAAGGARMRLRQMWLDGTGSNKK